MHYGRTIIIFDHVFRQQYDEIAENATFYLLHIYIPEKKGD